MHRMTFGELVIAITSVRKVFSLYISHMLCFFKNIHVFQYADMYKR